MPLREASYQIARRGFATSFNESELPPDFALKFRNRFINQVGGAEKRQGISSKGNDVSGAPNLTGIHELVLADSTAVLFVSGQGTIYRFDDPDYVSVQSGLDIAAVIRSVQIGDKLIFYNGLNRNIFTTDGIVFDEQRAKIEVGAATADTDDSSIHDSDVDNWIVDTNVAVNDLVFNKTVNGFGVIAAVATASVAHTTISSAATGIGLVTGIQQAGDRYEMLDLVELNVIPTDGDDDNVFIAAVGASATGIVASAVNDWTATDVRLGDFIRNTTRAAVTEVTAITTAALRCVGITGQTDGDSIVLLKSAMPITKKAHIHFKRMYMSDERDQRLVRITGSGNPFDLTTDAGTLDSSTFSFGELQPTGDAVVSMASFQRFFVITGRQNTYLYSGTDPISDGTAVVDFDIIGLFPHGTVSPDGLISIGNDVAFISNDGVQTASLVSDSSTLGRANIADPIKTTIRDLISTTPEAEIIAFHYPKRSWLCIKIGSELYIYNYTPYYGQDRLRSSTRGDILSTKDGSWSLFDGKFARQNAYFIRRDGVLLCVGAGGRVYEFDQGGFDDDGETYTTEYETGWNTLDEPKKRVNIKKVSYIKLILDTAGAIVYTIHGEGAFSIESSETVLVTADTSESIGVGIIGETTIGGSSIDNIKFPMRLRGEQFRLNIKTSDQFGPDIISRITYYATKHGKR